MLLRRCSFIRRCGSFATALSPASCMLMIVETHPKERSPLRLRADGLLGKEQHASRAQWHLLHKFGDQKGRVIYFMSTDTKPVLSSAINLQSQFSQWPVLAHSMSQ